MPLTKATPFLIKIHPQNFHPQRSSFKSPETARNPCKAGAETGQSLYFPYISVTRKLDFCYRILI